MIRVSKTLLLAMGLSLGLPAISQAKPSAKPAGKVEGTLTAVNAAATPPTVTIVGRTTVTLNVTPTTRIEVGGAHAALSALVVGGRAEARFDPATLNAAQIEEGRAGAVTPPAAAREVEAVGKVLSADANAGQLALDVNGDGVVDATLVVNAGTEIKLGSVKLTPAQLALLDGLTVKVEVDPTNFVVRELKAATVGATPLTGTFQSFDPGTGTLVLNTASGAVTLIVPDNARLKIGKGNLASLPIGTTVQVLQLVNGDGTQIALSTTARVGKGSGKGSRSGTGGQDDPPGDDHGGNGADDPTGDDHGGAVGDDHGGGHSGHGGDDGPGQGNSILERR